MASNPIKGIKMARRNVGYRRSTTADLERPAFMPMLAVIDMTTTKNMTHAKI